MRITTVVGARPQFIKAAAISWAIRERHGITESLVHTGQHYDPALSDVFFRELDIPTPAHHLEVGSGRHGEMTGEMLKRIEEVLVRDRPDLVLVYGDTNSTLAAALAAAKLRIPVAHIEAGLRSFNRAMPEEVNRVVTDHLSRWLFCPTKTSVRHLASEGISTDVHHVGDVMYDVALRVADRASRESQFSKSKTPKSFVLATVHRAENTDDPHRLKTIFEALVELSRQFEVVVPLHPRTRKAVGQAGLSTASLTIIEPVGLIDMAWLEANAIVIVTDSGGVQKEAYFHRTPCVTVRTETEWVETVESGWNVLAAPSDMRAITRAVDIARHADERSDVTDYGDGKAAESIVGVLQKAVL